MGRSRSCARAFACSDASTATMRTTLEFHLWITPELDAKCEHLSDNFNFGAIFIGNQDREARCILYDIVEKSSRHQISASATDIRDNLPSANRTMHMKIVVHWALLVSDFNYRMPDTFPADIEPRGAETIWYVDRRDERFLCTRTGRKSFILFISDFCLAFDEGKHLLFITCPMLLHPIILSPESLSFDRLLDYIPEPQVHFIARRVVQLTEMSWRFGCLVNFEQALPGAGRLKQFTDLF